MNAIMDAVRAWENTELVTLQLAILDELKTRLLADRTPPPAASRPFEADEILSLLSDTPLPRHRPAFGDGATERLRRTFTGRPRLRVIGADERPTRARRGAFVKCDLQVIRQEG